MRADIRCTSTCVLLSSLSALYIHVGDLTISDTTLDEDSANNEFILTCISTGGPATTITWTRGSETAVGERMTVFDTTTANTTAQYTHTLTVTGTLGGLYECTVANRKPSSDSAMLNLGIIYNTCVFIVSA